MDNHSPGPWKLDPTARVSIHGTSCVAFIESNNTSIADVCASYNISDEEAMANARLIAAAPDLLDALCEAENLACIGDIVESDDPREFGGWGVWLKQARAAIAKVTSTELRQATP